MSGMLRRRPSLVALIACALAVPAGYAVASEVTADPIPPDFVASADCPDAVNAEWEKRGMPRDYYAGGCPTVEQAAADAEEFNLMRREGLTHIAESIQKYGDSADAGELQAVESGLEQLGGPYSRSKGN
jgi:hypothetical protein